MFAGVLVFFFKQKTAYEMRISDWSSDVCSSDLHDYEVKMRSIHRFIEEGDKVKVTMRFRGREMVHQDLGKQVLDRVREEMDPTAKVEQFPKLEGRQMTMVMAPRSEARRVGKECVSTGRSRWSPDH